jgi:hypothetical protein
MLECHVYVGGKQVGTALCWGEALRLWLSGSLKPLEELRASVERELGPARVVRHAAHMPLHTSLRASLKLARGRRASCWSALRTRRPP